ncbi:hypothetical protein EHE19_005015 [Ruminiclostridium herbifermentans]|uniref:Uncharacterized protein n=1 Tax=Ruminiclostridium herbifermentans TaxID=2488810 RepID=A0A4U7JCF3_9FIRM|nr:hypothetical protein [Ruminiclostridium herbifermentans]QNU67823.1 hypothetical protein EHE19_005015 [Ruminiclostridium herbifermentans]
MVLKKISDKYRQDELDMQKLIKETVDFSFGVAPIGTTLSSGSSTNNKNSISNITSSYNSTNIVKGSNDIAIYGDKDNQIVKNAQDALIKISKYIDGWSNCWTDESINSGTGTFIE